MSMPSSVIRNRAAIVQAARARTLRFTLITVETPFCFVLRERRTFSIVRRGSPSDCKLGSRPHPTIFPTSQTLRPRRAITDNSLVSHRPGNFVSGHSSCLEKLPGRPPEEPARSRCSDGFAMARPPRVERQLRCGILKISESFMIATKPDLARTAVETGKQRSWWQPHIWAGCSFPAWMRILAHHRFAVHWTRLICAALITILSVVHTALRGVQQVIYGRRIRRTKIRYAPIFIIGHWRSGTTLLHELLSLDERHTSPTTYACMEPNHFLLTEKLFTRWLSFLTPNRRPMDDMVAGFDRPQEDEFALCMLGQPSPYWKIAFPNQRPGIHDETDLEELPPVLMVDCSHANSEKKFAKQEDVWHSVLEQRAGGTKSLIGLMVESHLHEGSQPIPKNTADLKYGVSITDSCIGWETTERMLRWGYETLGKTIKAPVVTAV